MKYVILLLLVMCTTACSTYQSGPTVEDVCRKYTFHLLVRSGATEEEAAELIHSYDELAVTMIEECVIGN